MKCFTVKFENGISDLLYEEFLAMFIALRANVYVFKENTNQIPEKQKADMNTCEICGQLYKYHSSGHLRCPDIHKGCMMGYLETTFKNAILDGVKV